MGTRTRAPRARHSALLRLVERRVGEPLRQLDLTGLAGALTTAALIVHDDKDKEIPVDDAIALAAAWPGAKTLITERYGHRHIMFAPDVVDAVVAFIVGERGS